MPEMATTSATTSEATTSAGLIEHTAEGHETGLPEISIKAETIFHIGNVAVTNSMFMGTVTALLLVSVCLVLRSKLKTVPGKLQGWFEMVMEGGLDLMDSILGSREKSERYFPVVFSIFLFVLIANWLGLLPLSHIMIGHAPILRAATADLNFTIALAAMSVLGVNLLGVAAIGLRAHAGKFFINPLKNPIGSFVGILEFVSEFVKIISFSFRLFGNVFAGEVLLTIVAFLVPYVVPLPFLFLEVFVGLVQALIFSMLTLVFLGMATVSHDDHEAEHSKTVTAH